MDSRNQRLASYFRDKRFTAEQDDARLGMQGVCKYPRKIEIVCDQYESVVACVFADGRIGSIGRPHCGPMNCGMTHTCERRNPPRCQIHVEEKPHPSTGQMDFASLSEAGGIRKSLSDVLLFKIWKVGQ